MGNETIIFNSVNPTQVTSITLVGMILRCKMHFSLSKSNRGRFLLNLEPVHLFFGEGDLSDDNR
jgi:hypothetical protein